MILPSVRSSWIGRCGARLCIGVATVITALAVAGPASSATPLKIVQLGDSYSAGNGASGTYSVKGCYRNSTSWGQQFKNRLAATRPVDLIVRACSGGVIRDVTNERQMNDDELPVMLPGQQPRDAGAALAAAQQRCSSYYIGDERYDLTAEPTSHYFLNGSTHYTFRCRRYMTPQINAVDRSTDVVLLTIGGNDLHFADIVEQCFAVGVRDSRTCEKKINEARSGIGTVRTDLTDLLRKVKERMRDDARILLISYPYLEKNPKLTLGEWNPFAKDYPVGREVRALGDLGDSAQRDAVSAVNAEPGPRVVYVDGVKSLFAGHEPDGRVRSRNDARWIHEFDTATPAEWYHYNPTGHEKLAGLVPADVGGAASSLTGAEAGAVDIAFVIDTTGSMADSIESVKAKAQDIITRVQARTTTARFAVIDYRDFPERTGDSDDYPARLDRAFTADGTAANEAIQGLTLGYGGDSEETMFSALNMAFDLDWRPGAKKMVVVLSDAPPLSPEPITGFTSGQVVARSLALDPVETSVVNVGDAVSPDLEAVVTGTNGAVLSAVDTEAATQVEQAINLGIDRPFAWAAGPYVVRVGDQVTLDARGSYAIGSATITGYEWDTNGDGTTDLATIAPIAAFTPAGIYEGVVKLTVTDSVGRTALATAPLIVSRDGDDIRDEDDNCPNVANNGQEDTDGDSVGDACDPTPGIATADKPGVIESFGPTRRLALKSPRILSGRRAIQVKARCIGVKRKVCRGSITFTIKGKNLSTRYKLPVGRRTTLRARLSPKVRARLGTVKRLRVLILDKPRPGTVRRTRVAVTVPRVR